jgi:hypothetical protein
MQLPTSSAKPQVSASRFPIDHAVTAPAHHAPHLSQILVSSDLTPVRPNGPIVRAPLAWKEHAMSAFPGKLRKVLHISTKEERKQHRIERNALDARMKAEWMSTFTRDMNGMGRIDPDRRR